MRNEQQNQNTSTQSTVELPITLVNSILDYLKDRPFIQVASLINGVMTSAKNILQEDTHGENDG